MKPFNERRKVFDVYWTWQKCFIIFEGGKGIAEKAGDLYLPTKEPLKFNDIGHAVRQLLHDKYGYDDVPSVHKPLDLETFKEAEIRWYPIDL